MTDFWLCFLPLFVAVDAIAAASLDANQDTDENPHQNSNPDTDINTGSDRQAGRSDLYPHAHPHQDAQANVYRDAVADQHPDSHQYPTADRYTHSLQPGQIRDRRDHPRWYEI